MLPPPREHYDNLAPMVNHLHRSAYDFNQLDRPMVMPHSSYGRHVYPANLAEGKDWECACPKYVTESVHKGTNPLFTVKWMQNGKRVITGTSKGEVIIWKGLSFEFEKANTVHESSI